jgi:1,4-alpha-glucan branching enzyme
MSDLGIHPAEEDALLSGAHRDPHRVLGPHAVADPPGVVVRAWHPDALRCELLPAGGRPAAMERVGRHGLFAARLQGASPTLPYRLRFHFADGNRWERDDPYRFWPTLGDVDLYLWGEGRHLRPWTRFGARPIEWNGVDGVAFAVWAPSARGVALVGDVCGWDPRLLPMRQLGASGVFELFVPGMPDGAYYKYLVLGADGRARLKADPYAAWAERPPGAASRVFRSRHEWGDAEWMRRRRSRDVVREPLSTYEAHLGSWARVPEEGGRWLTYRELAPKLAGHLRSLGFDAVELLPVAEHPFDLSWGYQVSGYHAPTSRFGDPDDFRFFVDTLHRHGIAVIVDWVPGHFVKDEWALARFDGTALYEHDDPRRGEHPDWGTAIFNFGRHEVRNFLAGNALWWLEEMHVDGLRVDAVASMLYRDYSRREGEWVPSPHGGRDDHEAVELLRHVNEIVRLEAPGCFTIAEESTAWPGVTAPVRDGGLGFTLKWNMGWMHDTLRYFALEPVHRKFHQDQVTFAMLYEHSERFVNPLSHDEVVHGKGSLLRKMPGDPWQAMANLRTLLAYQFTRPGKELVFMGTELAPEDEWWCGASLPWHLEADPMRAGLRRLIGDLNALVHAHPCLFRSDPDPWTFSWIDCTDRDQSVLSYLRRDGEDVLVVVLNLTPVPRDGYRVGVPAPGRWHELLGTDAATYGGSGHFGNGEASAEATPWHGHPQSLRLRLPPLAAIVLGRA